MTERFDVVIVGGGSAGCVLASRLSEDPARTVLLLEAGEDHPPGREPPEILSPAHVVIFHGRRYLWPRLRVHPFRRDARRTRFYEQARVMGGGSAVNAQVGNRGIPADYDEWEAAGAAGWGWEGVLPCFRKLERDLDCGGPLHGSDGPMPIMRVRRENWPEFSEALARGLEAEGLADIVDQNGVFDDGYFAAAYTNENGRRVTAAMAYLTEAVRSRPNLSIRDRAFVTGLVMEGGRAAGVTVERAGAQARIDAGEVILAAGALHSPAILMRAGIGPRAELEALGIPVVADRPGVGANLRDHPGTHLCAYVPPERRLPPGTAKAGQLAVRFSSALTGAPVSDLYMHSGAKSGWHGVGQRVAYFYVWLNKPFATGRVRLASADPKVHPEVVMNLLGDDRDAARLAEGFRLVVRVLRRAEAEGAIAHPFAVRFSPFIRFMGEVRPRNRIVMGVLGRLLDGPAWLRRLLVRFVLSNAPPVDRLVADSSRLRAYLEAHALSVSHVSGTCRMGAADDPGAVVDAEGRVHGVTNLRVADASVMPTLPRANTNLATLMIAEKMAAAIAGEGRAHAREPAAGARENA